MKMISFRVSNPDSELIDKIVDRFMGGADPSEESLDVTMDLTACHANGCPLDLQKLLDAPDATFFHDVRGIRRFINRETGQIPKSSFSPRCAAKGHAA
jgi:hypothetical protein